MSQLPIGRPYSVSLLLCFKNNQDLHSTGCIEYLRRFGYSDYQVYLLLSCAPVQGHIAGIVDIPKYVHFSHHTPLPSSSCQTKLTIAPAQPWDCQWTSSISTSHPQAQPRNWTWAAAPSRRASRKARSRREARIVSIVGVVG